MFASCFCFLITQCMHNFGLFESLKLPKHQLSVHNNLPANVQKKVVFLLPTIIHRARVFQVVEDSRLIGNIMCKVENPYLVTFVIRTPIFKRHVVWCSSKNWY